MSIYIISLEWASGMVPDVTGLEKLLAANFKWLKLTEHSYLVKSASAPIDEGEVAFDASKSDGTMRKLIDVSKLHSLGWTHKVEIEDGVQKLFDWYKQSLES